MAHEEAIEKIQSVKGVKASSPVQPSIEERLIQRMKPDQKESFDLAMQEQAKLKVQPEKHQVTEAEKIDAAEKRSLMEQVSDSSRHQKSHQIAPEELVAQATEAMERIDQIKKRLETPNLEMKSSVQNLLRNRLNSIDESLKGALEKAAIVQKTEGAPEFSGPLTPVKRFLGLLSGGQEKLHQLQEAIALMGQSGEELQPSTMLAIQIKVGQIQHQIELFSNLLNKSLESTKTIMNVQV